MVDTVRRSRAGALIRSCHLAPTIAVTAFATILAATAGNGVGTCVLLAAAVLTGQLSIGWSNDLLDVGPDRQSGRTDKPLALDQVPPRAVAGAIAVVGLATVGFSLALGWRAGGLHLAAVGCGWVYNAWLKGTWWSWLPYALAFGALPGVATLARPDHLAPAGWAVLAGALFGITANLTNALPDIEADRAAGVEGLSGRVGGRVALLLAMVLLVAATWCVALGPPGPPSGSAWAGTALTLLVLLGVTPFLWRRAETRVPFYGLMAVVPIALAMIVLDGHHLH